MTDPSAADSGIGEDIRANAKRVEAFVAAGDRHAATALAGQLLGADDELVRQNPLVARSIAAAGSALLSVGVASPSDSLLAKAIQALSKNASVPPQDLIVPLNNLFIAYQDLGDRDGAMRATAWIGGIAERLDTARDVDTAEVLIRFGKRYLESGRAKSAVVMFRPVYRFICGRADAQPKTLASTFSMYVRALADAGVTDDIDEVADRCVAIGPDIPVAQRSAVMTYLSAIGSELARIGHSSAERVLERAVSLAHALPPRAIGADSDVDTAEGSAFHNLATRYLRLGGPEKVASAAKLMDRVVELIVVGGRAGTAEHAGALSQLAVITAARGDTAKAEDLFKTSLSMYDNAPESNRAEVSDFTIDFGMTLLKSGRAMDAVPVFERALTLRDNQAESAERRAAALSNLATAYFESGAFDRATPLYEKAVALRLAL